MFGFGWKDLGLHAGEDPGRPSKVVVFSPIKLKFDYPVPVNGA
jgi:hypothetical protein